jgi:hypothetical protein
MKNQEEQGPKIDSSLFAEAPWVNLPETIKDEEDQDFGLPDAEHDDEVLEELEDSTEEGEVIEAEVIPPIEPQDYGLPTSYSDLEDEFGEENAPAGFKQLFDNRAHSDITKLTETPPKMVLPLVRARIIDAAYDTERVTSGASLLEIFVQEFDKRMISKDRKGRLEAVELIRGLQRGESDEEEANF